MGVPRSSQPTVLPVFFFTTRRAFPWISSPAAIGGSPVLSTVSPQFPVFVLAVGGTGSSAPGVGSDHLREVVLLDATLHLGSARKLRDLAERVCSKCHQVRLPQRTTALSNGIIMACRGRSVHAKMRVRRGISCTRRHEDRRGDPQTARWRKAALNT